MNRLIIYVAFLVAIIATAIAFYQLGKWSVVDNHGILKKKYCWEYEKMFIDGNRAVIRGDTFYLIKIGER